MQLYLHAAVWLWTIVAFTGARAAAMSLNRIIDAEIDSKNPRTSQRAIPQGKINKNQALLFASLPSPLCLLQPANCRHCV